MSLLTAQLNLFSSVSDLDKMLFTKHLYIMLKSGITISETLETILLQTKSQYFASILKKILADIKNGQQLNKSLSKFPKVFDSFYINLVKIGEDSGNLEKNLLYLSIKMEKDLSLKKKIQGVALYPAFVLIAALVMGVALSLFVLPKMNDLFGSLGLDLPLSTKILMATSTFIKNYNILILVVLIILGILAGIFVNLKPIKPHYHRMLLSLPLIGTFLQGIQLAYFCRNLGVMLQGGLTITSSLDVVYETTENLVYKQYFKQLRDVIDKGKMMSDDLLSKKYFFIPPLVTRMIGVGEKSGNLEEMLLYLGDFYEEETDNIAKNFSTLLEPILLIIIGLVVAFVAMAIISPIYSITSGIRR